MRSFLIQLALLTVMALPLGAGVAPAQPVPKIASKGAGTWTFLLEVDEDLDVQRAVGELSLTGPGLQPAHVAINDAPDKSVTWHNLFISNNLWKNSS